MDRRAFVVAAASLLAAPLAAEAQPAERIPRIGIIPSMAPSDGAPNVEAFTQGLRNLGYFEAKNVLLEYRWNEPGGRSDPDLYATEFVRRNVDVIVVGSGRAALAAKKATATIPIVIAVAPDPVGEGLVTSLAHPGGNLTGLSFLSTELASKQLELLKTAVPGVSRVACLWTGRIPAHALLRRELEETARRLGVTLHALEVRDPDQLEAAFVAMKRERANGLLVLPNAMWITHQARLHDLAARYRLPAMYSLLRHAEAGGLMAYGADPRDSWRRAAGYVDKILRGAKPANLPIEQPTQFELVINLKTAKALGLTIPQSVLVRPDQVIE